MRYVVVQVHIFAMHFNILIFFHAKYIHDKFNCQFRQEFWGLRIYINFSKIQQRFDTCMSLYTALIVDKINELFLKIHFYIKNTCNQNLKVLLLSTNKLI